MLFETATNWAVIGVTKDNMCEYSEVSIGSTKSIGSSALSSTYVKKWCAVIAYYCILSV